MSTEQLCLAYSNLARATRQSGSRQSTRVSLCIDHLISVIHSAPTENAQSDEYKKRLILTLISVMSAVPFRLLPRVLDEVKLAVADAPDSEWKEELLEKVRQEIMDQVGDAEKEYCLNWWNELIVESTSRQRANKGGDGSLIG